MNKIPAKYRSVLMCLALAVITLAVFYQVHSFGFVTFDDPDYVYNNPNIQAGITLKTVKWALTTGYAANWHPLTWISYMLDWQLFGDNPAGYHITNLLFHIINTLLLFIVLEKMTNAFWQSVFVAALFGIHPLHVESVAWISERKDVLSTFFWLLTMWVYFHYVNRPKILNYLLVVLLLALGLMAKPMLVTLPFVLLLLDYWPLGRIPDKELDSAAARKVAGSSRLGIVRHLVLEKIPLFILSAVSSVIAFIAQKTGGSIASTAAVPVKLRIVNALVSYATYIGKMFWPSRLTMFYPYTFSKLTVQSAAAPLLLLLAVSAVVLRLAKRHRYMVTGWFWYIGTLVPVIGIVQVGSQAMADRYTYTTLTGLFIIIVWGISELSKRWRHRRIVLWTSSLVVLSVLAAAAHIQTRYWRNSITLYRHALEVTEDNYIAHFNMTQPLIEQNRIDEAIRHAYEAVRLRPASSLYANGLGVTLYKAGRIEEAVPYFKKAIEIDPNFAEAHTNLADAYATEGRYAEAVRYYRIALAAKDIPATHGNLGYSLRKLGLFSEAVTEYRKALLAMPDDPNILNQLGYTLVHIGQPEQAIPLFNKALRIAPDSVGIHLNIGLEFARVGRLPEAVREYEKVLTFQPDNLAALNALGVALYKAGSIEEAVPYFKRAIEIDPNFADAHTNLAGAYATEGRYAEAVRYYRIALAAKDVPATHGNLGYSLLKLGLFSEAVTEYRKALLAMPDDPNILNELGYTLVHIGQPEQAIPLFNKALRIAPDSVGVHLNIGLDFASVGRLPEAVREYEKVLTFQPDNLAALNALGVALGRQGKLNEAVECFNRVLQIKPDSAAAHRNLGYTLALQGRLDEAVMHYSEALRLDPDDAATHYELGRVLLRMGKINEAIVHFQDAVRLKPDWDEPVNTLAWYFAVSNDAEIYNPDEAVKLALRACELTNNQKPDFLDTLAVAYAAKGDFGKAVETAEKALALCQSPQQNTLKHEIEQRLALYKTGKPYVEGK